MKKSSAAELVLLGVTFAWGATFVLVKEAILKMPPFTFIGIRFLFASMLIALYMFAAKRNTFREFPKTIWIPGIILGFWLFAGYAFQTFGLEYTTSSKAGFITGLSVVLVPFLSKWLLKHTISRNSIIGILFALVGLAFLSVVKDTSLNIGDLLLFLCAVSYGLQITLVGRYAPKFSVLPLALIQISSCGIFSMACAFCFENVRKSMSPSIWLDPWVLWALLICSVVATAVAFVAQNYFQVYTTPTRTALIFATEPVFAAITGYVWAGDRLSWLQVTGCILILAGMLISEMKIQLRFRREFKNGLYRTRH